MNVIQATSCFLPESHGGTETYVAELAQRLQHQNIRTIVVAPHDSDQSTQYQYSGISVFRYPVPAQPTEAQRREIVTHDRFEVFADWLKQQSASIYHQHSYRFDCGLHHLRLAKQLGMATLVTLHLPEPLCLNQTVMYKGIEPCQGQIDEQRCGTCLGMSEKVPAWMARSLGQVPVAWGQTAKAALHQQRSPRLRQLGTTLSTPALVSATRTRLQQLATVSDRIVVVCQWMYDALILNGIAPEKLILCPEASPIPAQPQLKRARPSNAPLRIGVLGRWHPIKGIHIVAEAVHRLPPEVSVELIIHASLHGKHHRGSEIQQQVMQLAQRDPRIQIRSVLPRPEIAQALAGFDLLAVPSQCQETGPLVVLEAFAVGTPILGANLGGIAELVNHDVQGWLLPFNNIEAWSDAITTLVQHPEILEQWQRSIGSVSTMDTVAGMMQRVYEQLLVERSPVAANHCACAGQH